MHPIPPTITPRPLLHEWSFGGLLLLFSLALWMVQGPASMDTWVFTGMTLLAGLVFLNTYKRMSTTALRVRLAYYAIIMNVTYLQLRTAVPALNPHTRDGWLFHIDRMLTGSTPSLLLQGWHHPWITEIMSGCYILFMPYLLFSIIYYLFAPPETSIRFYSGLFTLYAIGFLGYLLVPASGPWLALADRFTIPLDGGWITALNARMVFEGSNRVDVFPSLHCAVSSYLLLFDRRCKRWRFWFYVVPCVGLWASTLYLRYHYLIDILAGFTLAAVCLGVAFSRWLPWKEDRHDLRAASP